jgi:prepilin signal peptidase PulO-like enzyme (type II secretory pathway)
LSLKIFKTECKAVEKVFVGILGINLLTLILSYNFSTATLPITLTTYLVIVIIFLLLSYIAYIDLKTMEIDNKLSLILMLSILAINLFLYFFLDQETGLIISDNFSYIPYNNFFLALFLALIFLLVVLVSKEKAMGAGDIRLAIIVGLLIGKSNLIPWLYITIFSAIIYGLLLGNKKKKFKRLKIPFAPFMILGAIVSLLIDMYF